MSFPSSNGHWSGSNFFIMLEGDNAKCAVKFMIADKTVSDNWLLGKVIPKKSLVC
jgi:hypothetical protein